jgi:hypothetical protein
MSFGKSIGLAAAAGVWRYLSHPDPGAHRRSVWVDRVARVMGVRERPSMGGEKR